MFRDNVFTIAVSLLTQQPPPPNSRIAEIRAIKLHKNHRIIIIMYTVYNYGLESHAQPHQKYYCTAADGEELAFVLDPFHDK